MPAVSAMAIAPHKADAMSAPPARADAFKQSHQNQRGNCDASYKTPATRSDEGIRKAKASGIEAPTANVAAEVSAVCIGRAAVTSVLPSSSRAWMLNASLAISYSAT